MQYISAILICKRACVNPVPPMSAASSTLDPTTDRSHQAVRRELIEMHQEFDTNFTSVVNLTMKFLPHLMAHEGGASVIYTGSIWPLTQN